MTDQISEDEALLAALVRQETVRFRASRAPEPLMYSVDDVAHTSNPSPLIGKAMSKVDRHFGQFAATIASYQVHYFNKALWGLWPNDPEEPTHFFDSTPEFVDDVLVEWAYMTDDKKGLRRLIIFHCKNEDDAVLLKLSLKPERT